MNSLSYDKYLDAVLGGWIGKSMGGAIGARFEGNKSWIEIKSTEMFPDKMPPNDDLDLQVLWLKVLEEKGPALTSDDLAAAWLEGCWYPFNEYGIFRRNWQLGIHAPYSGSFGNQFWETGMGCPIRAEVWGYVFPGAPHLAAKFAEMDGTLDHTAQSVGAEKMFAAMSSMAFFIHDVRQLSEMFIHYLPAGSTIERLTQLAFRCHDDGMSLREAHEAIMLQGGCPEACDSTVNVPFTFLGLLYGQDDLEKTMLAALKCGYDTDCTLATAGALLGQIIGAKKIEPGLLKSVGDELVMGIQYKRPEMTLSALARDTARVGVLLSKHYGTMKIAGSPELKPFPATAEIPATHVTVDYLGQPAAAPGDAVEVRVSVHGKIAPGATLKLHTDIPGWTIVPAEFQPTANAREFAATLHAPAWGQRGSSPWPQKHLFHATLAKDGKTIADHPFGIAGAAVYQLLGVHYDPALPEGDPNRGRFFFQHHFANLNREYVPELKIDAAAQWKAMERALGRRPIVVSYDHGIDITKIVGLAGPCCAYLERTIVSPDDREVHLVVGNSDAVRIYMNGEKALESDEVLMWAPFNTCAKVKLKKGENKMLIKAIRRADASRLTLGFRSNPDAFHNCADWTIDLADALPGRP